MAAIRRLALATAPALLALALAACAATPGGRSGVGQPTAPAAVAEADAPPARQRLDRPRAPSAARPAAWMTRPSPALPEGLIGADRQRLVALLGPPGLRRREPPAEVWRYSGVACALHLFLYRVAADDYRVVHAEARRRGDGAATADCLRSLLDERRGGHS